MPIISKQKKEKISEQILHYLFSKSPEAQFTSKIAEEIARDEEFTLDLLNSLEKNNIVIKVKKNSKGMYYLRRTRWRLSEKAYQAYKYHQYP